LCERLFGENELYKPEFAWYKSVALIT